MNRKIVACTPLCEEDAVYIPQYLAEVERMEVGFFVYLDRCSVGTKDALRRHPACLGSVSQDDPAVDYQENVREQLYQKAVEHGCCMTILWDADETWSRDAPGLVQDWRQRKDWDCLRATWLNLWGDREHVRLDNPSNPERVKVHRVNGTVQWRWVGGIVVDPYPSRQVRQLDSGLVCLNHGLMTYELRLQHKARWDRIYGRMNGKNPYDYWDLLLDEERYPPVIAQNIYS